MARATYYVLQEFELSGGKWRPKQPRTVASREIASRAVDRLRSRNLPCIAFSRAGDPGTGDFDEAEIIASFDVPPAFMGDYADV